MFLMFVLLFGSWAKPGGGGATTLGAGSFLAFLGFKLFDGKNGEAAELPPKDGKSAVLFGLQVALLVGNDGGAWLGISEIMPTFDLISMLTLS